MGSIFTLVVYAKWELHARMEFQKNKRNKRKNKIFSVIIVKL